MAEQGITAKQSQAFDEFKADTERLFLWDKSSIQYRLWDIIKAGGGDGDAVNAAKNQVHELLSETTIAITRRLRVRVEEPDPARDPDDGDPLERWMATTVRETLEETKGSLHLLGQFLFTADRGHYWNSRVGRMLNDAAHSLRGPVFDLIENCK